MYLHICGVILAGGKSSRMGTNKSLLPINGKPTIQHIAEELQKITKDIIIISNHPSDYDFLPFKIYEDRFLDKGPLAGIESALYYQPADLYLFAACDMPFIQADIYQLLLANMEDNDVIIPKYEERIHPLAGIYRKTVLPYVQQQLSKDDLKVRRLFDYLKVKYVGDYPEIAGEILTKHFFNMNKPEEYQKALKYKE